MTARDYAAQVSSRLLELEHLRGAEDALLRFAAGQDHKDACLLGSALADDAWVQFISPSPAHDLKGKAAIVELLFSRASRLNTHHVVANQRIAVNEVFAFGSALADVLYVAEDSFLLRKEKYAFEIELKEGLWVLRSLCIETVWESGSSSLLTRPTRGLGSSEN